MKQQLFDTLRKSGSFRRIGNALTILMLMAMAGYSQTPYPGGISTNLRLWLKADAGAMNGASPATNGQVLTAWQDQSGSGNHFSAPTPEGVVTGAPTWISNAANFNPALGFNGTQGLQLLSNLYTNNSNINIFNVHTNGATSSGNVFVNNSNDNPNPIFGGYGYGQFMRSNATYFDVVNGGTWDPNVYHISRTNTGGSNYSVTNYFAGKVVGTASSTLGFAVNNNKTTIGYRSYSTASARQPRTDGPIHEVIVYSGSLTATQQQQINTYLALKYGSTLDQTTATNYIASDGTTVFWNGTTNSGYKSNIAGIARDDNSGLSQKQSKSSIGGLQVAIGNGNTIAATNAANTNNFSVNKSALVWGDNAGSSSWTVTGAPASRQVLARTWKVQESGTVGSVKVQIADDSGSNGLPAEVTTVYLLVDADGNFSSGATEYAMTLNGTNWEANVDFTNGQFFTFATMVPPTPGGVSSTLRLWLKADAGVTTSGGDVTLWADQSGNGLSPGVSNLLAPVNNGPTYITGSSINFNPSVDFNGLTEGIGLNSLPIGQNDEYTAFFIRERDAGAGTIFSQENTAGGIIPAFFAQGRQAMITGVSTQQQINPNVLTTTPNLFTFRRDNTGGNNWIISTNTDGGVPAQSATLSFNSTMTTPLGDFSIGYRRLNQTSTGTNQYDGRIGEVVIYNSLLSSTDVQKVESYLALKYGITLINSYLASNGATIYNVSSFGNDVAGIGRDDNSGLNQKQSQSVNTNTLVAMGLGTVASSNAANSNTFPVNNSFLIWGHDAGTLTLATAVSGANLIRMARLWKVQETGTVGSVKVRIPTSAIVLGAGETAYLIKSSDASISSADAAIAMTVNGSNYEATVDFTNGNFFTFAKDNQLPVDLELVMTVDKTTVSSGQTLQYVLTLTNSGSTTATNVIIKDKLPAGLTVTSATPSLGTFDTSTKIWTIPMMAPGAVTLTINTTVQ